MAFIDVWDGTLALRPYSVVPCHRDIMDQHNMEFLSSLSHNVGSTRDLTAGLSKAGLPRVAIRINCWTSGAAQHVFKSIWYAGNAMQCFESLPPEKLLQMQHNY
jgi:hypothetical protein